jgi:HlyD family secretion protein
VRKLSKRWPWLLGLALVSAAALAARSIGGNQTREGLAAIRRGDLLIEAPAAGVLVAARSVDITAPISSDPHFFKIARMTPEGTRVQAGQTVMELDSQEVAQKLRDYEAEVGRTQEELSKRQLEYDLQLRDLRVRIEQAQVGRETAALKADVEPHLISAQERKQNALELEQSTQEHKLLDEKLSATDRMMKSELAVLDRNLANARLRLERSQALQGACLVKAPIAGTVVYKVMADGAKRKVGEQTCHHEIILQIPDISTLRLQAAVEETYAALVQVGQPVRVRLDALPDMTVTGRIVEAGMLLHTRRDSPIKVIDVVIDLDALDARLSPGMTATAQIEVERITNALLAPLRSVHERDGRVLVRVMAPDGRVDERVVRPGRRNQEFLQVIDGLREGERVLM